MGARSVVIECRGPDGRVRAKSPATRAEEIQRNALDRYTAATTPVGKAAAAFDYARAAAVAAAKAGLDTRPALEQATRVLWSIGEALTAALAALAEEQGERR